MKPVYLVGPTAVGKSAVALEIAGRCGGEIISVDSMQVYRGLDIGTAKPSAAEQIRVPHHLIDIVDLTAAFDAAQFVTGTDGVMAELKRRDAVPVFCGGTGFYLKAWLEGLGSAPSSDPQLRADLEALPLAELLAELEGADPVTYARIDRENPRRIVRAVEVVRLTGKPFSEQRAVWAEDSGEAVHCLVREPDDLRRRIDRRVDEMFGSGLVDETVRLLECGLAGNRAAMQAIGYRQVVEHLEGERDLPATIQLIKTKTWQFARRQMTWFRNQLRAKMIPVAADDTVSSIADHLVGTLGE
jgi:tRNA dimethylallyltransferase